MGARIVVAFAIFRRRQLQEPSGDEMRLSEQEPADLRNMGAGDDVDQIILAFGVEGIGTGEVARARMRPVT